MQALLVFAVVTKLCRGFLISARHVTRSASMVDRKSNTCRFARRVMTGNRGGNPKVEGSNRFSAAKRSRLAAMQDLSTCRYHLYASRGVEAAGFGSGPRSNRRVRSNVEAEGGEGTRERTKHRHGDDLSNPRAMCGCSISSSTWLTVTENGLSRSCTRRGGWSDARSAIAMPSLPAISR
jgi:hypothetical protein